MKILLVKIFLLHSIIIASVFPFIFLLTTKDNISPAEYKYELLRKIKSPKIILIGGSNAFIGIDSEKISKELNMNIVNMGFTFGYGLKYMIEEVKDYINENDIFVIIPEPVLFYKDNFYGREKVIYTLFRNRPLNIFYYFRDYRLFKNIILKDFDYFIGTMQKRVIKNLFHFKKLFIKRNYDFKLYNKYGDCIHYLNIKTMDKLTGEEEIFLDKNNFSKDAIDYLNNFYKKMNKKNVKVIMYLGCIPDYYYLDNKKNLEELDEWLEENIMIPKITSVIDQVYPRDYFTDTINHLNGKGREIRTEKLINDLKLFLNLKE